MGRIKEKRFICVLLVLIVAVVLLNTSDVQVQAASLKLNKTSIVLVKGTTYNLKVSGTSKKPTWSSKNKGIAAVKKRGSKAAKVTAKKTGTTYIYAKVAKKTLKCKVKVVNSRLNYTSKSIYKGSKLTLYTRGRGVGKWKSSNTSIAVVTSKGKVTAKRVGKCYIYAYVGNSRLRCLLTVKNRPQPKPDAKLLTTEVTVDLEYPACIGIKGGTPTKWESTDTSIATVSYDKEEEEEKDKGLERDGIHLDSNGRDKLVYNHQIVESTNLAAMKNALLCDPIVRSF